MPLYRLIDTETQETVKFRTMDHEAAHVLNAELGDAGESQRWVRGLNQTGYKPRTKSLTGILRSLDTEGFNEHSVNVVEKWLRQRGKDSRRDNESLSVLRKAFTKIVKPLVAEDRKTVGRFIGKQAARMFEAGVNIGMSAFATKAADAQLCVSCGGGKVIVEMEQIENPPNVVVALENLLDCYDELDALNPEVIAEAQVALDRANGVTELPEKDRGLIYVCPECGYQAESWDDFDGHDEVDGKYEPTGEPCNRGRTYWLRTLEVKQED